MIIEKTVEEVVSQRYLPGSALQDALTRDGIDQPPPPSSCSKIDLQPSGHAGTTQQKHAKRLVSLARTKIESKQ